LTKSLKITVFAHAQYKFNPKSPERLAVTSSGLQVAMHPQLQPFLVTTTTTTTIIIIIIIIIFILHFATCYIFYCVQ